MEMESGAFAQPALDKRRLVSSEVVQNDVDIELIRNRGIDFDEELPELLRPMLWVAFTEHLSRRHVKGCKQVRRSMPNVVVRTTLRLA